MAVPKLTDAVSGHNAPVPRVSHALSLPLAIISSPSGIPVISATSFEIVPIISPGFISSHSFSLSTL